MKDSVELKNKKKEMLKRLSFDSNYIEKVNKVLNNDIIKIRD